MNRLPYWLKKKVGSGARQLEVEHLVQGNGLHTVCQESFCPNKGDCFGKGVLTFQILGNICTRNCAFCGENTGRPMPPDPDEPERVAKVTATLNLKHVVITSPARDDLTDGGAGQFAATIQAVRRALPGCSVEVLVPDFNGDDSAIGTVINAGPDVFNHNVETVRRLQREIRPKANYERSLYVLRYSSCIKTTKTVAKSGIIIGLGEKTEELEQSFHDLAEVRVTVLTIGQYLPPSLQHRQVSKFYSPDEFEYLRNLALTNGIKHVYANPFMRSSYNAEQTFAAARPV